jgi:hypothetical protein
MAVVTISGFLLPLIPVAKGMTITGMMIPARTIRTMISMSVKPLLFTVLSSEFVVFSSRNFEIALFS